MSRKKRESIAQAIEAAAQTKRQPINRIKYFIAGGVLLLLVTGVIASAYSEQLKTSFVARGNAPNGSSFLQPLPTATPTPQLAKEYVYAGGRMLATEQPGSAINQNPVDLMVWRIISGSGYWFIQDGQSTATQTQVYGSAGDTPTPADFDGDGLYDFCVFRPNYPSSGYATWIVQPNNASTYTVTQYGLTGDTPKPADFDGDGRADLTVWRSGSSANFYILASSSNMIITQQIGTTGDIPVPFDFDGDGKADAAVFRPSNANWVIKKSTDGTTSTQQFGATSGEPVPGDYDGDGKFDLATRDSSNSWSVKQSSTGNTVALTWGVSGDIAVQGDYDSDGKTLDRLLVHLAKHEQRDALRAVGSRR
jgi:hypothetical protein